MSAISYNLLFVIITKYLYFLSKEILKSSGWMQTIRNKIQGHFKDFEKKIKDMKKWFIHPWKPLPEAIRELELFDTILCGLKQSTLLIKSWFRLGLVLDDDPQTPAPPQKAPTIRLFEHTFQTILRRKNNVHRKILF